jgi:hypothetical protein
MRVAVAVVMFLVSGAAGWIAFDLYRHLQTPPPGVVALPSMTEHSVLVGGQLFTPVQVFGALITVAVITAGGGIAVLVAGHERNERD